MMITDPALALPFRRDLVRAMFRDAQFHVEASSKQGGRRIATHEFPKRESPYAEDMGRHAFRFTVRAYCITYPFNFQPPLLMHDYRLARDLLQARLDDGTPGALTLPTLTPTGAGTASMMPMPITVVCEHYTLSEEEVKGGYCTFDIGFVEFGVPPNNPVQSTRIAAIATAQQLIATSVTKTRLPPHLIPGRPPGTQFVR